MKIVTNFTTLMMLAQELGQARMSGDLDRIEKAQKKHDEYRDIVLLSDEMIIPRVDNS